MYDQLIPFTFFLDMLGFANKVGRIDNQDNADSFIKFMEVNKSIFKGWIEIGEQSKQHASVINIVNCYDFKYAFISDSIVMSFVPKKLYRPVNEEIRYRHSANLFYLMVNRINTILTNTLQEHKILLRGGVSTKFSYIQNEFVVGEGLVEAYKLESSKAIYPRIILSKEITDNSKFMSALKFTSNKMYNHSRLIKRDTDGYFYIDYLGYMISQSEINKIRKKISIKHYGIEKDKEEREKISAMNDIFFNFHKEAIEDMYLFLEKNKGSQHYEHIKEKYLWIKNYHNSHMKSNFKVM